MNENATVSDDIMVEILDRLTVHKDGVLGQVQDWHEKLVSTVTAWYSTGLERAEPQFLMYCRDLGLLA